MGDRRHWRIVAGGSTAIRRSRTGPGRTRGERSQEVKRSPHRSGRGAPAAKTGMRSSRANAVVRKVRSRQDLHGMRHARSRPVRPRAFRGMRARREGPGARRMLPRSRSAMHVDADSLHSLPDPSSSDRCPWISGFPCVSVDRRDLLIPYRGIGSLSRCEGFPQEGNDSDESGRCGGPEGPRETGRRAGGRLRKAGDGQEQGTSKGQGKGRSSCRTKPARRFSRV